MRSADFAFLHSTFFAFRVRLCSPDCVVPSVLIQIRILIGLKTFRFFVKQSVNEPSISDSSGLMHLPTASYNVGIVAVLLNVKVTSMKSVD